MNGERHLLAKWFLLELHMVVSIGGIRKFTFDVSNKNGTAHREFGRNQVEFVRLQSLRKMTGEGIGKRGRLALIFNLRVTIVCRRLATTYGKAAVKGKHALVFGGEVQGISHRMQWTSSHNDEILHRNFIVCLMILSH